MVANTNTLTPGYLRLLNNKQLDKKYRDCLEEFINNVIANNRENIETILLYGGIVRDSKVYDNWSDIDIIVVFKDITRRNAIDLTKILQNLETRYSIRIDLTQISLKELTDGTLAKYCFNSQILSALSMRENVSIVVFGRVPSLSFTPEQEKQAAKFYLTHTLGLFREYLVEVLYRRGDQDHAKTDLKRITRWTFSIIRASLRLFNIYAHPYEYSLPFVKQIFPELDISLLQELINIRKDPRVFNNFSEIVQKVETFIEEYVVLCLKKYTNEIEKMNNE